MVIKRGIIIALACGGLLMGLVLAMASGVWLAIGIGSLIVAGLVAGRRYRSLMLLIAVLTVVGLARGWQARQELAALDPCVGQKITVQATVADDPVPANNFTSVRLDRAKLNGRTLPLQLSAITSSTSLKRGFRVEVSGKVRPTTRGRGDLGFVTVQVVSDQLGWLERLRQKFIAGIHTALPDPVGGFALGLLLGARALIPKDLQAQLTATGLSHLVAVSGYNLTIIARALQKPLARLSFRLSIIGALWAVGLFVVVAGASASIDRAAVVSVLSLTATYYGRQLSPWALLALPAALTAMVTPIYLWYDVGWWLSFAAFAGILGVAPVLERLKLNAVLQAVGESLAAQLLTFPIILAVFGQFSPVSPAANALVLPLVPLAMLVAVIAGLGGWLVPIVAGWLALPASWLLHFILWLVGQMSGWPGANLQLQVSTTEIALVGLIVAAVIALAIRRWRRVQPLTEQVRMV